MLFLALRYGQQVGAGCAKKGGQSATKTTPFTAEGQGSM